MNDFRISNPSGAFGGPVSGVLSGVGDPLVPVSKKSKRSFTSAFKRWKPLSSKRKRRRAMLIAAGVSVPLAVAATAAGYTLYNTGRLGAFLLDLKRQAEKVQNAPFWMTPQGIRRAAWQGRKEWKTPSRRNMDRWVANSPLRRRRMGTPLAPRNLFPTPPLFPAVPY